MGGSYSDVSRGMVVLAGGGPLLPGRHWLHRAHSSTAAGAGQGPLQTQVRGWGFNQCGRNPEEAYVAQ